MPLNHDDLNLIFTSESAAIAFCNELGLIDKNRYCKCVNQKICYVEHENSNFKCGVCLECPNCHKRVSLFSNTIFARTKLPISKVLQLIYFWAHEYSLEKTHQESRISKKTISKLFSEMQDICEECNKIYFDYKIGGEFRTVEIDETVISKRKYNCGRMLPEIWVFGGICVETDEIFIKIVQNRKAETLIPLIESSIMPGSIIVSDCWKSYDGIQYLETAFQHFTVNHRYNFVDPETGFNTQKCERLWRSLKEFKHQNHGIQRSRINSYIQEFIFRYNTKMKKMDDPFLFFLKVISQMNK